MSSRTSLILSHASALAYWLNALEPAKQAASSSRKCQRVLDATRGAVHLRELDELLNSPRFAKLIRPVDLLTGSRNDRRKTSRATYHCIQATLPDNSLIRIACDQDEERFGFDVFACSPELCFVQMAKKLPMWELLELGFEICGNYRKPADQYSKEKEAAVIAPKTGMASRNISTPEKLQAFTASCLGMTGAKPARQASKWLIADSCSSEETRICMLAFLPRSLGGMGTARPLLNQRIAAPDVVARVLGTRTLTPDLYWTDARVALEYDGRIWNDARARDEYEIRKRNAYRIMGIDVVSISRSDLNDPEKVRGKFKLINRKCGKRLKEANDKQRARQNQLMNWIATRE